MSLRTSPCSHPQVGPPPGGPAYVLFYLPVVFFTANGIPGEVDEQLDTKEGIVSAGMRALGTGAGRPRQPFTVKQLTLEAGRLRWLQTRSCVYDFHGCEWSEVLNAQRGCVWRR